MHLLTPVSYTCFSCCFIRKVNLLPSSISDTQTITPPNCFTIFFEMCKPSPIPWVFSSWVTSRNPNSLNNFFWSSTFIPVPLSAMDTYRQPNLAFLTRFSTSSSPIYKFPLKSWRFKSSTLEMDLTPISILPPWGVNFSAFESKFMITC